MMRRTSDNPITMQMYQPSVTDTALDISVIAYENVHRPVFHEWLKLEPTLRRDVWRDRYVFYSCACCLGAYVEEQMKHDFEGTNLFVRAVLADVVYLAEERVLFSEEWFKGIDRLVKDFTKLNFISEARNLVAIGLRTGVKKYPGLAVSFEAHAAYLDALIGRREKAAKTALKLIQRPYLLPRRHELPTLFQQLMYILAAGNFLWEYRLVLWNGVNLLHANHAMRDTFSAQISKTYRGTVRAVINGDVPLKYRIPFILAYLAGAVSRVRLLNRLGFDKPIRLAHLTLLLIFHWFFFRKNELFRLASRAQSGLTSTNARRGSRLNLARMNLWRRPYKILVTRAMGGIGDILMMTPGLRALAHKHRSAQIDFAIPKSFHSLLEGFPYVRLLDIHEDAILLHEYRRWINLTDCPAGRVESKQAPNVRRNRIEIFANAMGVTKWQLKLGGGHLPFYRVSDDERAWARSRLTELNPDRRPVIGIQPYAADTYRNWPYMEQLAAELSRDHCVLIFHHEHIPGYLSTNIFKIIEPLRRSIALASLCDKLIVLDSSFLHVSASLNIPAIAIFGAISGKLRTKKYPNVTLLAPRKKEFPCYPCWRHEHRPCHLTNGRESICLRSIKLDEVLTALKTSYGKQKGRRSLFKGMISWLRYGNE